jgi:hypothetical protein
MTISDNLVTEHNVSTGEIIIREYTEEELEKIQADKAARLAEETSAAAASEAKRLAKLAALSRIGLTEEEIESLF